MKNQQEWTPPPKNVFKANVDAAPRSKDQKAGLAAVLTDLNGKVIAAGINQSLLKEYVSFAEAEAIE